ncbi:M57 family metalloprotease [Chitinophaga japonensis]|uniref:Dual-action HEIGH metallo-peptidase n=1 Tax=Chitinophaga japonensis TaxID=104662 RepID=A0A562T061_CHIJA|nr:M57 family metalloprotease [Chitinophaga japonensis]TWI86917.1 dual-action HEIGH metallo-peptidase [Chitinophaga japonensis]
MKKTLALFTMLTAVLLFSCRKDNQRPKQEKVPDDIISKLKTAGFDTSEGLSKYKDGYLVEYDIFLTAEAIERLAEEKDRTRPQVEHYRTNNLVTGTPRVISVFLDAGFDSYMQSAFNTALARYNQLRLGLTFQPAASADVADINIFSFYEVSDVLGFSAGGPSGGDPASPIRLNTYYYNSGSHRADAATTIAHEIGHAIGFRHTDYQNRTFSCGIGGNEGTGGDGANPVEGTPTGNPDYKVANSWMLACSSNTDRPFTAYDKIALHRTYPNNEDMKPVYGYTVASGNPGHHYLSVVPVNNLDYWVSEDVAFRAYISPINGAVPVRAYFSQQGSDHYFTTGTLNPDNWWQYEGIAFYAFTTQVPGTVPIYEHYSSMYGGDHYYSMSANIAGYGTYWTNFNGVVFYAFPNY